MTAWVSRARASARDAFSRSPSRSAVAVSVSTVTRSSSTRRATRRTIRTGCAGMTAATRIPARPPISASMQRSIPPVSVGGSSVVTSTAETAAWLTNNVPPSVKTATTSASATTSTSCQRPLPIRAISRSPTSTPMLTPTTSSAVRRSRELSDMPRLSTAAIGAKNGRV
ncbi:hypothetical protein Ae717Ps2_5189 [Pseudonocardia sp. Ae717_Ps2]|nr:hypothetical protein Ae717Ps2_5189 [Pseudonocardia sp. Ae717_Ps2]